MLGLEPTLEPGNPWNHKIPVTPIMDTQIDDLVIKGILIPLTVRFLNNLKDKIDEKKRENWLDIYLAIFIMMSNVEWILKDVVEYTDRHGMKVWTQQILNSSGISPPTKLYANSFFFKSGSRGGTSLTAGYIHSCKTMLSYFHFACAGSTPLSICWSDPATRFEELTYDQIGYLLVIQQEISRQGQSSDMVCYGVQKLTNPRI